MNSDSSEAFQHPSPDPMPPHAGPHIAGSDRAHQASHAFLPEALQGGIPKIWVLLLEKGNRIVIEVTLYVLAFFTLFATIIGSPHQGEWVTLITAALAPLALTFWYILFPLNPYQTYFFVKKGLHDLDQKDRGASEFVSVLGSPEAGQFLWQRTQRMWIAFFVPLLVVSLVMPKFPHWEANASWLIRIPFYFVLLFSIFRIEMFDWAIRVMKRKE